MTYFGVFSRQAAAQLQAPAQAVAQPQGPAQAEAQILVIRKQLGPIQVAGNGNPASFFSEDYVSTHIVLIRSPLIVQRAINKRDLKSLVSFKGEEARLTELIMENLTIDRPVKEGQILTLSYRGATATDCTQVLTALIEGYKEFLEEDYKNVSDESLEQLSRIAETLEKAVREKEKSYAELLKKGPVQAGIHDPGSIQTRIQAIEAKKMALLFRRAEIRAKLTLLEKAGNKDPKQRDSLLQELEENSIIEKEVELLYAAEEERARSHALWKVDLERYREEIERTKHKLLDPIQTRLEELKLLQGTTGYDVRVIGAPRMKKAR